MNQSNPVINEAKETVVIGSVRIIEQPIRIKSAIFEDEIVKRAVFVDHEVKVPVGYDKVVNELALEISKAVLAIVQTSMDKQFKVLEDKVNSLRNIKTEEEVILKIKEVEVEKPNFVTRDIPVDKVSYVDKEVINPVLKDVEVTNAIIIDKAVTNAVINDIRITNAIIKDVEVERAIIREKVVDVIHPRYLNLKGDPE